MVAHSLLLACVLSSALAQSPNVEKPAMGLVFDTASYRGTPYKPLLTRASYAELPPRVSLERHCPTPGDQGRYGTCAAWAIGYHMRTVLYGIEHDLTDRARLDAMAFSPAFLYQAIKAPQDTDCQAGSNPVLALDTLKALGIPRAVTMPYACNVAPSQIALLEAVDYRIEDYAILYFLDEQEPQVRVDTTRKALAEGFPVVLCFIVPQSFYSPGKVWREQPSDNGPSGQHGRHAMLVVGYDDTLEGGCFRVLNSWGPNWADGGYVWIPYREYGLYSLGALQAYGPRLEDAASEGSALAQAWLGGKLTFEQRDGEAMAAYRAAEGQLELEELVAYRMSRSYPSGTRFRFRVTAESECYLYAYATDLTGEVTQILPFDDGMSPRIGRKSTLAFPSETKVIRMDDQPGSDYLLLLFSARPIDTKELLAELKASEGTLSTRATAALGERLISREHVRYSATEIGFALSKPPAGDIVPLMIELRHD
ncbi:MAG: DUF4384 domain-containing protein [Planctomycetes bacterium]|nr:DUF4384 domain-containing protein [Planctomycetota bacterium]